MGLTIELPSLRERGNDIILLAKYFADEFSRDNQLDPIQFSRESKEKLLKYHYPGNVRELKAVIDLAIVLSENNEIIPDNIHFSSSQKQDFITGNKTLKEYNNNIIQFYLNKYSNDVIATAKALDIGKSTIYKLIQTGEIKTNND
jgi:DNA-binding NtrC family response regulator